MTKRQFSRHQRDVRLQRFTRLGFAAVVALVVLIAGFGYWQTQIQPGGEAILRVRGVDISTQTYAKVLGWGQYAIDSQIGRWQSLAASQTQNAQSSDADYIQQFVRQQVQQLQQQRAGLEGQVIEELTNNEFYRQEAAKRNISVSPADVDAEIVKQNTPATDPETSTEQSPAGEASQESATPAATPTPEATPQPTPTPRSPQQIMTDLQTELNNVGLLTMDEYRELIVKPKVIQERLQTVFAAQVSPSQEQVWARHILVEQEADANDILSKVKAGEDFAQLAKDFSTDTGNKDKAGDLGWFIRGAMVPEFDQAAFALQPGEIVTAPVQTTFGYHVIQVLGHEQDRPLPDDQFKQAQDGALSRWLQAQREEEGAVEYGYSWERIKWAKDWVSSNAKYLKASKAPSAPVNQ